MKCIVTAGPTFEPLDQVRRFTNFSSGRLGGELANFLATRGHDVTLLLGQMATWTGDRRATRTQPFGSTADLSVRLAALGATPVDAVFHAAAVSDFAVGKVWHHAADGELAELSAGKIASRCHRLLVELVPTLKLIVHLRDWFPQATLVGWKYEVEGDRKSALRKGEHQLAECRTAACVVNGPAYGRAFGLVTGIGHCAHLDSPAALYLALEGLARQRAG